MIFDVYKPFLNKEGRWVPGIKPTPTEWGTIVDTLLKNEEYCKQIDEYRETGDKSKKETLPAINFVGRSTTTRQASTNSAIPSASGTSPIGAVSRII